MIQRIQSFWLVLAACCVALCLMVPVAEYHYTETANHGQVEADLGLLPKSHPEMFDQLANNADVITISQTATKMPTWPLAAGAAVVVLLSVVCIFLYKNRVRQVKWVGVTFLLNVVFVLALLFWGVDSYADRLVALVPGEGMKITWFAGAYSPIISLIFLVLARSAIRRDEAKVRAADRLR